MYYRLNGIPCPTPPTTGELFFFLDAQNACLPSAGDKRFDIEEVCVELHQDFVRAIFPDLSAYYAGLPLLPQFVPMAGMNSESTVSKTGFEQLLKAVEDYPNLNRYLYLYDCQKLVAAIQETTKEVGQILGEFYRTLNTEPLFYPPLVHPDGVRYSTSPTVTKLFSFVSFLFVRLHSLLDYTVKLVIEAQGVRTNFDTYPKMRSANDQYGDRKKVNFNGRAGTLFEVCEAMTLVETLRNHLIHDGLLDDMPKAYEVFENGVVIERYLLAPDMTAGRFDRSKNRGLFYGGEHKLNEMLPPVLFDFQTRQVATLLQVRANLQKARA